MGSLEICRPKGKLHAFFFRDGKALRNPHIIRLHAEKPGDDGPIGAVAFSRGGEGTVHTDTASTGSAPRSFLVISPILAAPAVWELDGPTITGPRMSKMFILLPSFSIVFVFPAVCFPF